MKSCQGRTVCQAGVAEGCRDRANSAGKVGESAKMVPVSPSQGRILAATPPGGHFSQVSPHSGYALLNLLLLCWVPGWVSLCTSPLRVKSQCPSALRVCWT